MSYTDAKVKLRELALLDATLQARFGGGTPPKPVFRWFDRQIAQNVVADRVAGGTCVAVTRVGTIRGMNQGGVMNLEAPRIQFLVYDLISQNAADAAEEIIAFMGTINLCVEQVSSPVIPISSNPNIFLSNIDGMVPNPQSPSGPIYTQVVDFRVYNRTDLAAA